MAYLKGDSTPIRREAKRRRACKRIGESCIEKIEKKTPKSYPICSSFSIDEGAKKPSFFKGKSFGRG